MECFSFDFWAWKLRLDVEATRRVQKGRIGEVDGWRLFGAGSVVSFWYRAFEAL